MPSSTFVSIGVIGGHKKKTSSLPAIIEIASPTLTSALQHGNFAPSLFTTNSK